MSENTFCTKSETWGRCSYGNGTAFNDRPCDEDPNGAIAYHRAHISRARARGDSWHDYAYHHTMVRELRSECHLGWHCFPVNARCIAPVMPKPVRHTVVRITYCAAPNGRSGHGWLPIVKDDGHLCSSTWASKGYDREEAEERARAWAEEIAGRYIGDWDIRVERVAV